MKRFTLEELGSLLGAKWIGHPAHIVTGVDTLDEASSTDVSFLANPRYLEAMKQSRAGVICVSSEMSIPGNKNLLISEDPSLLFQRIAALFLAHETPLHPWSGIHSTAVIHETANIGVGVTIGPYAVIDAHASIGDHCSIGAHVYIGYETTLGSDCRIYPSVVIRERCQLGQRVIVQPGAIIGSCGFGYVPDATGRHIKLEQLGNVIVENDVEIGANTTIDRSRFKTTRIRQGTKIDNLVQIAHNVEIGEHNLIAALTGIAGSAKTGKQVMLGGQVGIVGHVELADGVMIATRGGVSKNLPRGKYRGSPAIPISDYHRQEVHVRKLEEYVERLKKVEAALRPHEGTAAQGVGTVMTANENQ